MMKIRYANINDAKILGEIHSLSWKEAYKGIIPDEILSNRTPEKRQKHFENAISEGGEEIAIILVDDKPIGFIRIGKCRDVDKSSSYGEIWGIYLLEEWWNKGLGYESMVWGLNELAKRQYKKVTLWVLEENLRARRFYEKIGFQHDGTIKEIQIGRKLNEYRYVKDIT